MTAEKKLAKLLHLTYNEINILVYYLCIPLSWAAIIDLRTGFPILSLLIVLLWIFIFYRTKGRFKLFCDVMFRLSQLFLLKFEAVGWNYVVSSVILGVVVPIIIYIGLALL